MEDLSNRYVIKIPKFISCYLCNNKKFLLIKGKFGFKFVELKIKFYMSIVNDLIFVTKEPLYLSSGVKKKNLKIIQGTTVGLIKKYFLDVSRKSYKKLKLYGVGFKVVLIEFKKMKLLQLNIGYSHNIYFKIPKDILIIVYTPTKFIIFGTSNEKVATTADQIRRYKIPDAYKGKGILYENEKIILKEGKKA